MTGKVITIILGAAILGNVVAGGLYINALDEVGTLEDQLKSAQATPAAISMSINKSSDAVGLRGELLQKGQEVGQYRMEVRDLERKLSQKDKQIEQLIHQLAMAAEGEPQVSMKVPEKGAANVDVPDVGEEEDTEWTQADRREMSKLAKAIGMTDEEQALSEKVMRNGQKQWEAILSELQESGDATFQTIERRGDELSRQIEEQIAKVLSTEKADKFRKWVEKQRQEFGE